MEVHEHNPISWLHAGSAETCDSTQAGEPGEHLIHQHERSSSAVTAIHGGSQLQDNHSKTEPEA